MKCFRRFFNYKTSTTSAISIIAIFLFSNYSYAQDNRVYTVGIHFASGAGVSSAQGYDIAKSLLNTMTNEHGYKVKLEKFASWEEVQKAFIDGNLDAAYLKTSHIAEVIDSGMIIRPWASFSVEGRPKEAFCLWHKKSEIQISISDITGKSFIFYEINSLNMVKLRNYLAENGIDIPLWKVFDSFVSVPNQNSAFMALAMGDADFFWTGDDGDIFLNLMNKNLAVELEHDLCTKREYARGTIVFNGKKVSEKEIAQIREDLVDVVKNINKYAKQNRELEALKSYMKLAKITFALADYNEFDTEVKLYKKAKSKGWLEEITFISDKLQDIQPGKPLSVRPDYKMCKNMCDSAADPMKCVDKCME